MECLIWDWNGTLLDDAAASLASLNVMLVRRRLPPITLRRYRRSFGFPVKPYYAQLGFDLGTEDWDRICVEFHEAYRRFARDSRLRPGASRALQRFRGLGLRMHVLSASETGLLEAMVRARGIADCFISLRGLDNLHGGSKEKTGLSLMAAHGIAGRDVLLVGDTSHDHEVACALGCRCVLMEGGHQSPERLRACGRPVVRDMRSLVAFVVEQAGGRA
jgi:phosphoglycolate phosphatase